MNEKARDLMRQRIDKMKISQKEIAAKLSMTESQVSRILSGERDTTIENILAIAEVLNLDRRYFLALAAGLPTDSNQDQWVRRLEHQLSQITDERDREIIERTIDILSPTKKAKTERRIKHEGSS